MVVVASSSRPISLVRNNRREKQVCATTTTRQSCPGGYSKRHTQTVDRTHASTILKRIGGRTRRHPMTHRQTNTSTQWQQVDQFGFIVRFSPYKTIPNKPFYTRMLIQYALHMLLGRSGSRIVSRFRDPYPRKEYV